MPVRQVSAAPSLLALGETSTRPVTNQRIFKGNVRKPEQDTVFDELMGWASNQSRVAQRHESASDDCSLIDTRLVPIHFMNPLRTMLDGRRRCAVAVISAPVGGRRRRAGVG
jgi:hypothetical protein